MSKSKYLERLSPLLLRPFFTAKEASIEGVPRHALAHFVNCNRLERIYPGVYRCVDYESQEEPQRENLALIAGSIPAGVICLISALCYYNLTDQVMRKVWIAVPHRSCCPKRPNTKVVRMRNTDLGKESISLGGHTVQIFNEERCIIDAFRYLGHEIAIKALQKYFQKSSRPNVKRLGDYAKKLRVNITPYILAYST